MERVKYFERKLVAYIPLEDILFLNLILFDILNIGKIQ
jgi:hypothetical protein